MLTCRNLKFVRGGWAVGWIFAVLGLWLAAGTYHLIPPFNKDSQTLSTASLTLGSAAGDCRAPVEIPLIFTQPEGTSAVAMSLELSWPTEAFEERYLQSGSSQNQPQFLRGASLLSGQGADFLLVSFPADQQGQQIPGRWQVSLFPNTQGSATTIPEGEIIRIRFFAKTGAVAGVYPIRFQPGSVILSTALSQTISAVVTADGSVTLGSCASSTITTTSSTLAITTSTSSVTTTTIPVQGPAVRTFTGCFAVGLSMRVNITVDPPTNTQVYMAEETLPAGWIASDISHGGRWDTVNQQVKWGPFFDSQRRTLSYSTAPANQVSGVAAFVGRVSFDGNLMDIFGATNGPQCRFHPSDTDLNWRINSEEIKLYGNAWKAGQSWTILPSPIPLDYAIRAAYLWKTGELYAHDTLVDCPLCWNSLFSTSTGISPLSSVLFSSRQTPKESSSSSAIRSMPLSYLPDRPVSVYLAVYPGTATLASGIEETVPPGWVVQSMDNGGSWDSKGKKVRWGPFFGYTQKVLNYTVLPPFASSGEQVFSGLVCFDGVNGIIAGQNTLSPVTTTLVASTTTSTTVSSSTTLAGTARFFPSLVNSTDRRTSFSIVNPYSSDAAIAFEAYSDQGERIAVSTSYLLAPAQQLARVATEIFPDLPKGFNGWMVMKSNIGQLPGLFLHFDDQLNYMDGAAVSDKVVQDFLFPLKDNAELFLLNPKSNVTVPYHLEFVSSQGSVLSTRSGTIPPLGRVVLASNSLVPDSEIPGYFQGYSNSGITPLEIVQSNTDWMAVLNGIDVQSAAEELFAPHYIVDSGYETVMNVINLTFNPNLIRMELFDPGGKKLGNTVQIDLPARGSQQFSGVGMFGVEPPVNGYIRLRGGKLTGSILFTDPQGRSIASTLQFVDSGRKEWIYSQVAQSKEFYTGLAAINVNNQPVVLQVEVFEEEWGVRRGWGSVTIPAGGKIGRLLSELVGPLPMMTRGYFKVRADMPISTFALFGTWNGQVLSAIPSP